MTTVTNQKECACVVCVCVYLCICVSVCVVSVCECVHVCMYVCVYVYMYECKSRAEQACLLPIFLGNHSFLANVACQIQ
jgi:hypothetical protein